MVFSVTVNVIVVAIALLLHMIKIKIINFKFIMFLLMIVSDAQIAYGCCVLDSDVRLKLDAASKASRR